MCDIQEELFTLPCSAQDPTLLRAQAGACGVDATLPTSQLCRALRHRARSGPAAFKAASTTSCAKQALAQVQPQPHDVPGLIRALEAAIRQQSTAHHRRDAKDPDSPKGRSKAAAAAAAAAAALALMEDWSLWNPRDREDDGNDAVARAVGHARARCGTSKAHSEVDARERLEALCETAGAHALPARLRVQTAGGRTLVPAADPKKGSWNSFLTFDELEGVALRRALPGVLSKKVAQGVLGQEVAQRRLDQEMAIAALMAAAGVGPALLGHTREYHPGARDEDGPLRSYTTMPMRYRGTVREYIRNGANVQESAANYGRAIVTRSFQTANLGYCHLDIKLGNMVWRIVRTKSGEPRIDLRFIDFDPLYMASIDTDASLVRALAEALSTSHASACNVLRLFYATVMMLLVTMQAEKLQRLASASATSKPEEAKRLRALLSSLSKALRGVKAPFDTLLALARSRSDMLPCICKRMYHYNYASAQEAVQRERAVQRSEQDDRARTGASSPLATRELRFEEIQQVVLPIFEAKLARSVGSMTAGVTELAAGGEEPFTTLSCGWRKGKSRQFQTEAYAQVCGTAGEEGLVTLGADAPLPPELPRRIGPRTLLALRRLARVTAKAYVLLQREQLQRGPRSAKSIEAAKALRKLLAAQDTGAATLPGPRAPRASGSEENEGSSPAQMEAEEAEARSISTKTEALQALAQQLQSGAEDGVED